MDELQKYQRALKQFKRVHSEKADFLKHVNQYFANNAIRIEPDELETWFDLDERRRIAYDYRLKNNRLMISCDLKPMRTMISEERFNQAMTLVRYENEELVLMFEEVKTWKAGVIQKLDEIINAIGK